MRVLIWLSHVKYASLNGMLKTLCKLFFDHKITFATFLLIIYVMSESYLQYIPNIISNPFANAVLLTFVPGIFYTLAAYGQLYLKWASLTLSIVTSIVFAIIEYIIRVPIIKYSGGPVGMSNGTMQVVWVCVTLLLGWGTDIVFPRS